MPSDIWAWTLVIEKTIVTITAETPDRMVRSLVKFTLEWDIVCIRTTNVRERQYCGAICNNLWHLMPLLCMYTYVLGRTSPLLREDGMRLCRFDDDRLGLVDGGAVIDVTAALECLPQYRWPFPAGDPLVARLSEVCRAADKLKASGKKYDLRQVRLLSPIANPSKIMAAPANYR